MQQNTDINALTEQVIACAMRVHSRLGAGLLESVYETCLCIELEKAQIPCERQRSVSIEYDGTLIENALKIDLLVDKTIVVELKAVESILPVHAAQTLTYMKLTNMPHGIILNFNVPHLKNGIRRFDLRQNLSSPTPLLPVQKKKQP